MKFLHEYLTYQNGVVIDNGWWLIDGCHLVNRNGGYHIYTPSDTDIIVEKDGWNDVLRDTIRDDSNVTGWIAPDGEFFGCSAMDHELIASILFDMDEVTMEKMGYIKVYEIPYQTIIQMTMNGTKAHRYEAIITRIMASEAQIATLKSKGFTQETNTLWVM